MDKWDVTVTSQSEYLDYKFDEDIDIIPPLRKAIHQASLHDVGIIKMPYEFVRKKARREEYFNGEVVQDAQGNPTQPGLVSFLQQYPEAVEPGNEGHWVFKSLAEGNEETFKSDYQETTYDDPMPSFVDIRDLFVPLNTEGYKGLCDAKLIVERQDYTWWELRKAEQNGDFENVDDCKNLVNQEESDKDAKNEDDL